LQKARHHHHKDGSDGLSAHGFRYSFTPLPGYFSPFPHGTHPLSVTRKYSALPGGPGRFTRNSTSPVLLGHAHTVTPFVFRLRDSHPLRSCFPPGSTTQTPPQTDHAEPDHARPTTPPQQHQHA